MSGPCTLVDAFSSVWIREGKRVIRMDADGPGMVRPADSKAGRGKKSDARVERVGGNGNGMVGYWCGMVSSTARSSSGGTVMCFH